MRNTIIQNVRYELKQKGAKGFLSYSPYNRTYLSGFTGSTGYVLITEAEAIFIADFRYVERVKKQCPQYDIVVMSNEHNIYDILNDKCLDKILIEEDFVTVAHKKSFDKSCPNIEFLDGSEIIKKLRGNKLPVEIEYIKRSCEITSKTFEKLLKDIKIGVSELDLVEKVKLYMKELGADAPMFITVLAGANTSQPHGMPSDYIIKNGDFVTVDIGSYYKGYGSDLTRTVVVGKASPKQKKIYDIVLEAQLEVYNQVKVGMTGKDLDKVARDCIKKYGYDKEFGHGLGHGVGMQLADLPRVTNALEGDNILNENMIFTNEPGIYEEGFGGVRIEDTLLLKENSYEILTKVDKKMLEI